MEKLAAVDVGEDEVELLGVLEGELERHDERVVHLREDGALRERVRHFGAGDDVRLANRLEGVDTS